MSALLQGAKALTLTLKVIRCITLIENFFTLSVYFCTNLLNTRQLEVYKQCFVAYHRPSLPSHMFFLGGRVQFMICAEIDQSLID